jgi:cephalosporin-C deacetylase-like acetyl esterase
MRVQVPLEVLMAVSLKSTVFWNVTPCSVFAIYRRLGGTNCIRVQATMKTEENEPMSFVPDSTSSHRNMRDQVSPM